MQPDKRVVIAPEEGESVSLGALGVVHKISGRDTGGSFSVVEHPDLPFQHEGVLVLVGVRVRKSPQRARLHGMFVGEDEYRATQGTYVLKPRGVPHTFWNPGPRPARI